jgi:hypothetical protein
MDMNTAARRVTIFAWFLAFPVACNMAQTGCTDPLAGNYSPSATVNDGSCTYDTVYVSPVKSMELSMEVEETSGLIFWDGYLWTQNDDTDNRIFGLDTATAKIKKTHILWKVVNYDWEEISQDKNYIYLGDFGNNGGNRTDLHILRVDKSSLKGGKPSIDTIWFTYPDQVDFSPATLNQTEFDCEAFVVSRDSIYLFTKQWLTANTTVYSLSKEPGTQVAKKRTTYAIGGLVTGATYLEDKRLVVLCGYSGLLQPFIYLLYDYPDHSFFEGNRRLVKLSILFHQVEGIATADGLTYFLSNEFSGLGPGGFHNLQKLHRFDLTPYLGEYLGRD